MPGARRIRGRHRLHTELHWWMNQAVAAAYSMYDRGLLSPQTNWKRRVDLPAGRDQAHVRTLHIRGQLAGLISTPR
jgi:hypothetical protein